jgi:predicted phosphodiesterase
MPGRIGAAIAIIATSFLAGTTARAATLVRGPYVQNNTPSSVLLIWKHVPAGLGTIDYGPTLDYGHSLDAGTDTLHVASITGLAPATRYYYRVRAGTEVLASGDTHWFETSAASGGVRVVLFGDSGKGNTTQARMARRIVRQEADLVLHTGDIVYSSGEELKYNSRFFTPYAELLRHTPIYTSPGNHDLYTHGGLPYYNNFYLPTERSFDGSESHYSFDWGDAHFVSINSTQVTRPVADWVASDLAASDKRWKFAWFHHAVYSCGYHGSNANADSLLVPVFEAQGVDIVFTGHEHDYQRTHPIRADQPLQQGDDRNYVNPGGPLYVITGGGAEPRATSSLCWFTNIARSIPHVSRMQIAGDCLFFSAVDSTGAMVDSMSIRKTVDPSAPFVQLLRGNGHEQWSAGDRERITWMAGGVESTLDLEISRDGGQTFTTLAAGVAASGTAMWAVGGPATSNARLRLVARAAATGNPVVDVSDAPIEIIVPAVPASPPVVVVTANPSSGEGIPTFTFNGSAAAVGAATIADVAWELSDGTTTAQNPLVHSFLDAGTHVARCTATDDLGASTTDSVTVRVFASVAPALATRSPEAGATDVAALSSLVMSVVDRGAGVRAADIVLRIDGTAVTPTCTGSADSLVVRYTPAGGFASGDTVSVALQATDGAAPPNTASWSWDFVVSAAPVVNTSVNFQPSTFTTPSGFVADRGALYSTATGFGWDKSVSSEVRGTNLAPELTSYVYITNTSSALWQLAVPNGVYLVSLVVGSPAYTGLHRVTIEDLIAVNNVATSDRQFHTVTDFPVTVADGFLSVRIGGISGNTKKTKLCWLRVQSNGAATGGGTAVNSPPELVVSATPSAGAAPLAVQLAAVTSDPDGDAVTITWSFGDGGSGSGATASHTYAAGSFPAIALATDARGASMRDTVLVTATAAPDDGGDGGGDAIARINFQPSTFALPSGYTADSGKLFDAVRGSGWSASLKTEAHVYSDPRLASYVYITNTSAATWDLVVENGNYAVTLVAGSPAFTGLHRVEVEGAVAIANIATGSGGFVTVTDLPVTVADGRLSVRIGGIAGSTKKTKLCYLHVDRASSKADISMAPGIRLYAEPNPGRPHTRVRLASGTATQARIDIFDVRGRRVRTLFEGAVPRGAIELPWDGRLTSGTLVANGVYYMRALTPQHHWVLKLTVVR